MRTRAFAITVARLWPIAMMDRAWSPSGIAGKDFPPAGKPLPLAPITHRRTQSPQRPASSATWQMQSRRVALLRPDAYPSDDVFVPEEDVGGVHTQGDGLMAAKMRRSRSPAAVSPTITSSVSTRSPAASSAASPEQEALASRVEVLEQTMRRQQFQLRQQAQAARPRKERSPSPAPPQRASSPSPALAFGSRVEMTSSLLSEESDGSTSAQGFFDGLRFIPPPKVGGLTNGSAHHPPPAARRSSPPPPSERRENGKEAVRQQRRQPSTSRPSSSGISPFHQRTAAEAAVSALEAQVKTLQWQLDESSRVTAREVAAAKEAMRQVQLEQREQIQVLTERLAEHERCILRLCACEPNDAREWADARHDANSLLGGHVHSAATSLQAAMRGRLERTNDILDRRLERARSSGSLTQLPVGSGEIWPRDEQDEHAAATSLQAVMRGRLDRTNEILDRRLERARSSSSLTPVPAENAATWSAENTAATKMQSALRGRHDRTNVVLERRLERVRSSSSLNEQIPVVHSPERRVVVDEEAAVRLQAAVRGRLDRARPVHNPDSLEMRWDAARRERTAATAVQAAMRGRLERAKTMPSMPTFPSAPSHEVDDDPPPSLPPSPAPPSSPTPREDPDSPMMRILHESGGFLSEWWSGVEEAVAKTVTAREEEHTAATSLQAAVRGRSARLERARTSALLLDDGGELSERSRSGSWASLLMQETRE